MFLSKEKDGIKRSINIVNIFIFRYNISWTVESYAPVEEYKLYFRRLPDTQNDLSNSIEQSQPLQHHTGFPYNTNNNNFHTMNHRNMHWRNDWRDVVLPAVPPSHLYTQSMSYVIRNLEADQHYEARVQAR